MTLFEDRVSQNPMVLFRSLFGTNSLILKVTITWISLGYTMIYPILRWNHILLPVIHVPNGKPMGLPHETRPTSSFHPRDPSEERHRGASPQHLEELCDALHRWTCDLRRPRAWKLAEAFQHERGATVDMRRLRGVCCVLCLVTWSRNRIWNIFNLLV